MTWPFKKKEEVEEEIEEEEERPIYEDEKERGRFSKVAADVEKIKALISSLEEKRKVDGEKFSRINEQIGELRSSSVEREKQIKEMEVAAMKSIDMVKEVQPEKLMNEVKKEDTKINKLESHMERYEDNLSQVIQELKEIRSKMELFKGYEELLKLNEETKEELRNIKKMEITMDIHTNKVERLFIDFQKKYSEFENFKKITEYMEEIYRACIKEINDIKVRATNFIEKKHIIGLEKSVMGKTEKIDEFLKRNDLIIEPTINKLIKRIKSQDQELMQLKENLIAIQQIYKKIYNILKTIK